MSSVFILKYKYFNFVMGNACLIRNGASISGVAASRADCGEKNLVRVYMRSVNIRLLLLLNLPVKELVFHVV